MSELLFVRQMQVGPMGNFSYIVGCPETRQCVVIDAAWEIDQILAEVRKAGMTLVAALVTHCHPDHVGGNLLGKMIEGMPKLLEKTSIKAVVHTVELFGFQKFTRIADDRIQTVSAGEEYRFGNRALKAIHTPGHSEGGVCWYGHGALFSGDTLFLSNCGRVDLPGGSAEALYQSLVHVLAKLPDETRVYPGHAYDEAMSATLGEVKTMNPYIATTSMDAWRRLD